MKHPPKLRQFPKGHLATTLWMTLVTVLVVQQLLRAQPAGTSSTGNSSTTHSREPQRAVQQQLVLESPAESCNRAQQPAVALLMVILGHQNETRHGQYWLAVANRRAYALQHGFPLYLVDEHLGSGQHAAWEKLIAVQAVFQHSCADWVWMSDADAYVMTLERSIHDLAIHPQAFSHPNHVCGSPAAVPIDVVAASACITNINTGSMLWRNSNFTRSFITDAWHSKFIARPAGWWDQAAILHMYKIGNNKQHFCIVKQGAVNAFPTGNACNDGFGNFQEGDLLIHFPGGLKQAIADMDSHWLKAVPIAPTMTAAAAAAQIFTVSALTHGTELAPQQQSIHVHMHSSLYEGQSDMPTSFDVLIALQAEGHSNWGWPVAPEPTHEWIKVKQGVHGQG